MIPDNALSSVAVPAALLSPDSLVFFGGMPDYEQGGILLNDGSQGLQVQDWVLEIEDDKIVAVDSSGSRTTILTRPGVTEASLAFDNNMRATLAYMQNGVGKLWWFDTTISTMVDSSFAGISSPRLSNDDKRQMHQAENDIIFAYLRTNSLYYRQQRDRYLIERLLATGIRSDFRLRNFGMNKGLRLQFELGK